MGVATVLLTLAAVAAWAQPATQKPKPPPQAAAGGSALVREGSAATSRLFRQLDRNGDGYLTGAELGSPLGREVNWAAVDRDRAGRISPSEFTVIRRAP